MSITFTLYASDGATPVYTFPVVISANYPRSGKKIIEHENVRGKGSITIDGGNESWDLKIVSVLSANGYGALMSLIDSMESSIVLNTPYYLKIESDETGVSEYSYKVKRILPIEYPEDNLRTDSIECTCYLRVLSW